MSFDFWYLTNCNLLSVPCSTLPPGLIDDPSYIILRLVEVAVWPGLTSLDLAQIPRPVRTTLYRLGWQLTMVIQSRLREYRAYPRELHDRSIGWALGCAIPLTGCLGDDFTQPRTKFFDHLCIYTINNSLKYSSQSLFIRYKLHHSWQST